MRRDKFAPTLNIRRDNYEAVKSSIHSKMELNRDRAGYEIGPHTDSQGKWVTTLYYLAKDLVWVVHTAEVFPRYVPLLPFP